MKNFRGRGCSRTFPAAPYAVAAGAAFLVGSFFAIAKSAAANGAQVVGETDGDYDVAKKANDVFAFGDKIYWDDANKYLTSTAAGNKWVGVAAAAALAADATVAIALNGFAQ